MSVMEVSDLRTILDFKATGGILTLTNIILHISKKTDLSRSHMFISEGSTHNTIGRCQSKGRHIIKERDIVPYTDWELKKLKN